MISKFTVENFGSIKDRVILSMEADNSTHLEDYYIVKPNNKDRLLKMAFIYGANASGKTNIIKAITFLRAFVLAAPRVKNQEINFMPFLFQENALEKLSRFEVEFYSDQTKYLYEISLTRKAVHSERLYNLKTRKSLVFERVSNLNSETTVITFGSTVKISKTDREILEANTLWNNSVLSGYLKTNLESKDLQNAVHFFTQYLGDIIVPNTDLMGFTNNLLKNNSFLKPSIIELLQKADFKISDVSIENVKIQVTEELRSLVPNKFKEIFEENVVRGANEIEAQQLMFKHTVEGHTYNLPFDMESEGTKRYYEFSGILSSLIHSSAGLMIDEIESSLHPDLLKHFLLLYLVNSKNSQIICTSHYREFLMEKDLFRPDAVWFAEKQENGSTDLYSLVDFDTSVIRNTSSVYNAYKIGKLGAVPELSDPYINGNGKED
ncbi:ATPase/GTPase, AAA15 family [Cruoricaptor ignavus]|uniref:ATPase/GTPase, AAA15 family n=1 Tax=Cruoricaptor ignavus TaxID=1118202 RepID=A0A1M6EWL6_9FLAO|nr:ATP-binding protein [Cruoricaptor ignavus]SHI89803.1 ATPase/GTPase, AAA15 family [Cruoricaptor ignavus]